MAGQNGLLFSKVPRHRSAVYLRIEQSSQLKQEFFIIFQCPLDGEQFTLAVGSVNFVAFIFGSNFRNDLVQFCRGCFLTDTIFLDKYNYGKNYVIKSKQKDKIMLQNIAV